MGNSLDRLLSPFSRIIPNTLMLSGFHAGCFLGTAEVCLLHMLFLQALTHHDAFGIKIFPLQKLDLLFGRCSFQTPVFPKQSVPWITDFKIHAVTGWSVYSPPATCIKQFYSHLLCCLEQIAKVDTLIRCDFFILR